MFRAKILTILVLDCYIFSRIGADDFDPTKFDYCKITCTLEKKEFKHSACTCKRSAPREEIIPDDWKKFRQSMLDYHNHWRDYIAGGKEARLGYNITAANMQVLNYDLELEYIARCYAVNSFKKNLEPPMKNLHHDRCRLSHKKEAVGQNLYMVTKKVLIDELSGFGGNGIYKYDEVTGIKDRTVFEKYNSEGEWGHFSQMVWALTTHVGCCRLSNPSAASQKNKYALLCNYRQAGNYENKPIFIEGPPCSQCPAGLSCNTDRYPNLCGTLLPAPSDSPFMSEESERLTPNKILTCAGMFVLICDLLSDVFV